MKPLVSVVIPAYNPSEHIRSAIESAFAQTYAPLEVIVVDDGSTQDLGWIPRAFPSVRCARKANGGPASARNLGIRLAEGPYVAFLDADDIWEPEKLARQVAALERAPAAAFAYTALRRITAEGAPAPAGSSRPSARGGSIGELLFMKNVVPTSTVLARAERIREAGGFDEAPVLISVEDYDMWLRLAERHPVVYFDEPLVRYRVHPGGISRDIARSYFGERCVIEKARHRRSAGREPVAPRRLTRRYAQVFADEGEDYLAVGRIAEARAAFLRSLGQWPWSLRVLGRCLTTLLGRRGVAAAQALKRGLRRQGAPRTGAPPRRIRIMHVLWSLEVGGAEHVALNVLSRLDPARYERHVCGLTGAGPLAHEFAARGVRVHALAKRPGVDWRLWIALVRLFRRWRIELVHTHNATPWFYAGPAARLTGARLVHTEHSNLFPDQRRLRVAEGWLARMTRWIIADSDAVRRCLVEQQGLRPRRIVTVRNGIDTGRFAGGLEPAEARARLALDGAGPVIGTVARLVEVKDHPTLLAAFRRVVEEFPRAVLLVVGDGPLHEALEAQAQALGLTEQVRFLGRRTDIAEILPAFEVFVLSSLSEGLPLTVLEAMATGVPVVATDVGALREAVQEGRTGLLVPARSPERLAAAIRSLLRDPARRHAMGTEARRAARSAFDLSGMVHGYEAAYHH